MGSMTNLVLIGQLNFIKKTHTHSHIVIAGMAYVLRAVFDYKTIKTITTI
jgi:hypothetical protein